MYYEVVVMCCIDDGFMDGYSYVSQEDIEQE